jgi:hypothetical protein
MKPYIHTLTFLLLTINCCAQNNEIIDLKKKLTAKKDTNNVWILQSIAGLYFQEHPDSFYYYEKQALDLSKKMHFYKGEMQIRINITEFFYRTGKYPQALQLALETVKLADEAKDTLNLYWSLRNVMMTYEYLPEQSKQVLRYANTITDLVHSGFFKEPSQIEFLDLIGYTNHARFYYESLGNLDSALHFAQRSYEIASRQKNDEAMALALVSLAGINEETRNFELANTYYKMALYHSKNCGRYDVIADSEQALARLFMKNGHKDSALIYIVHALEDVKRSNNPSNIKQVYFEISNIYDSLNRYDSAYKYLRMNVAMKDSLYNKEKANSIENLVFAERLRQQDILDKAILEKKERTENLQYIGIALFIIIFTTFFLLFSHSIIANQKLIKFLGIVGLMILFEFVNMLIHPYLTHITNDSPLFMLIVMVAIATLLIPAHHFLEKWITHQLVEKNKRIRFAAAKKTIAKLEKEMAETPV